MVAASDSVFCFNNSKAEKTKHIRPRRSYTFTNKMFSILNIYPKVAKWKSSPKLFTDFWFLILVLVSVSVRVSVRNVNQKPRSRNQLHTDIPCSYIMFMSLNLLL